MSRRDRQRRRRRNRGSPLKRFVALTGVLFLCGLAVAGLAVAGWVVNVAQSAPNLTSLHPPALPGPPSQVFAADGTSLGFIRSNNIRLPIAGSAIPQRLKEATVAIEDRRFYQHGALDYQGILRAAIKDAVNGGTSLQGASTLTMQLIDNVYLPNKYKDNHNLKYKIVQAKLAEQLEGSHSKDWILDSYLNDVPYGTLGGEEAYGVAAAAEMFFDKPVSKLSLPQDALLAGLPQAPTDYNPFVDRAAAYRRRKEVLQSMVTAGYITQRQANFASGRSLQAHPGTSYQTRNQPYVFDFIQQQLARDLCPRHPNSCPQLYAGGMKIYSTIDLRKQALARQAILAHEGGPGQPAAGLASVDPLNGHVLAIASSSDYSTTSFDYATQAHRQPGSSFKVFALMTLIHDYHGDPNSTFYTSKLLQPGWLAADPTWTVHTAEDTYQGNISITKATVLSDNTVFAQLSADLGWDKFDAMAHAMGITSTLTGNPAEVIGGLTYGVTPLEMADAYSTISNGGTHVPATIINKVTFADGSVDNFGDPKRTPVFTDGEASTATTVLKGVITDGTGTAANYGCPAAGKTGTAENYENAWFVGYTPRMSTAVWVGYPQGNIPMANGFGGTLAAPIWHDYMQAASGSYCGDFPYPKVPFSGTAFFGRFAATGGSNTVPGNAPSGLNGGATTGATPTTGTGPGTTTSPSNNPTLNAKPPQPGPARSTTGSRGGASSGGARVKTH
jgi:penicillin-binding protein 1A